MIGSLGAKPLGRRTTAQVQSVVTRLTSLPNLSAQQKTTLGRARGVLENRNMKIASNLLAADTAAQEKAAADALAAENARRNADAANDAANAKVDADNLAAAQLAYDALQAAQPSTGTAPDFTTLTNGSPFPDYVAAASGGTSAPVATSDPLTDALAAANAPPEVATAGVSGKLGLIALAGLGAWLILRKKGRRASARSLVAR